MRTDCFTLCLLLVFSNDVYMCEDFLEQSGIIAGCLIIGTEMPGMRTIDLIQGLKSLGIIIPVIVMGDEDDMPMAVEVMRAGALAFIGKPFTDQRLKISIERMLPLMS